MRIKSKEFRVDHAAECGLSDSRCSEGGIEELCAGIHVGRPGHNRSEAVRSDKADTAIGCRRDNGADDAPQESFGHRQNPTSRETEHTTW